MVDSRLFFIAKNSKFELIELLEEFLLKIKQSPSNFPENKNIESLRGLKIRLAIPFKNLVDLKNKIEKAIYLLNSSRSHKFYSKEKIFITSTHFKPEKTLFLFPGFGSEFPSMLTGVDAKFGFISNWIEIFDELINGNKNSRIIKDEKWLESQLQKKKFGVSEAGPVGSIASLVFNNILKVLNVRCDAMLGHSNGENAALISSGLFSYKSRENFVQILRLLSNFPQSHEKEGVYLIINNFSKENLVHLLDAFPNKVCLAMNNCPGQQIIYAKNNVVEKVYYFIRKRFGLAFELITDHPYHTIFFKPLLDYLRPLYSRFDIKKAHTPVYSCVNSSLFPSDSKKVMSLALRQWVETVDFQKTIETAYADGFNTFIEVGPNNKLSGFVSNVLKGKDILVTNCSREGTPVLESILEMCSKLWVNHHEVDLSYFESNSDKVISPNNKFKSETARSASEKIFVAHQELMKNFLSVNENITKSYLKHANNRNPAKQNPKIEKRNKLLLNGMITKYDAKIEYEGHLDIRRHNLINDHSMGGLLPVLPFTMSLELLAEIASEFYGNDGESLTLFNVSAHKWFDFENDAVSLKAYASLDKKNPTGETVEIKIYNTTTVKGSKTPAFQGYLKNITNSKKNHHSINLNNNRNLPSISVKDFYKYHLFHGKCFKSIEKIEFWNKKGVVALFRMPDLSKAIKGVESPDFIIPGPMLDSTGQLMAYWLYELGIRNYAVFPFYLGSFEQYEKFPDSGSLIICKAQLAQEASVIKGNFEFEDLDGNLIGRLADFSLKLFVHDWIPSLLMNNLKNANLDTLSAEFLSDGGGIWRKILGKIKLDADEYKNWSNNSEITQIEKLLEGLKIYI
jgi:malonyl CoA-acyl carrier protein transacylase